LLINSNLPRSIPQLCNYIIHQPIHNYKYVQSHIVILHQHISVTAVTISRVAYNNNTINVQIIVKKCMMLHLICKTNITLAL